MFKFIKKKIMKILYRYFKKIENFVKSKDYEAREKDLRKNFKKIGIGVTIDPLSTFCPAKMIEIGDYTQIGPEAYIWAPGGLKIGTNVSIAARVHIHTSNHNYENAIAIPYDHRSILRPVTIGDNCWIGAGVLIAPGVEIGEGSIVAMGSVVTKNIPAFSIVGGNPATIIKMRNIDHYNNLKAQGLLIHKLNYERPVKYKMLSIEEFKINKDKEISYVE